MQNTQNQNNNPGIEKNRKDILQIKALLFLIFAGILFNFYPFIKNEVLAWIAADYTKGINDTLTFTMWNNLKNDFLRTDGGNSMSANLNVNNNKVVNLATPTANGDAVNKSYADALNTNAQTICANDLFLDGDGSCVSATDLVAAGGGSGSGLGTCRGVVIGSQPRGVGEVFFEPEWGGGAAERCPGSTGVTCNTSEWRLANLVHPNGEALCCQPPTGTNPRWFSVGMPCDDSCTTSIRPIAACNPATPAGQNCTTVGTYCCTGGGAPNSLMQCRM